MLVQTSQTTTSATIAQRISEPFGLPGSPPPPPPKRIRPRRRSSSIGVTERPPRPPRRPEDSPHGPPPWPSSGGGSSPLPAGPQGPLSSVKRPRTRPAHPRNVLIGNGYRGAPTRKTVARRDAD